MSTNLQNARMGIMSTATLEYTHITEQKNKTNYFFVSTFNAANSNAPFRFKSEQDRISAKLGFLSYNNCR